MATRTEPIAPVELLSQALGRGRTMLRALETNFLWDPTSTDTVPASLQRWALERPRDPYLSFEGRSWTIGAFDGEVNRHARAWRELGIEAGQVVALVLENRPAFLFHFYALTKLGAVASLINPALREAALAHALRVCEPSAILAGDLELEALLALGADALPVARDRLFVDVEHEGAPRASEGALAEAALWNPRVSGILPLALAEAELQDLQDVAAYIYTSGTTGLPKPAVVKHHRLRRAGDIFAGISRLSSSDALYVCLPLYHASGMVVGVSMSFAARTRLVLERKFSASRFWTRCREEQVTVVLYIGELCRYLHNTPPGPDDTRHQVRCFVGNGLRPDIWDEFKARFGVDRIAEFYAATEGNAETANLFNLSGTVGPIMPWKMKLARWDPERGELERGPDGFAVVAKAGEPGVLLGKIDERNPFAGYTQREASQRKVLRDVFAAGDAWFDSGDLLRRDRLWHLHFVDRLGDTFRWKGENVSTQEVGEALNLAPGVRESTVYGVEVPGAEGRAGMAAIVVEEGVDFSSVYAHVSEALPAYAVPRFIRVVEELATTGTFKHQKNALRDAGWEPASVGTSVWVRDPNRRSYVELDEDSCAAIRAGRWPL